MFEDLRICCLRDDGSDGESAVSGSAQRLGFGLRRLPRFPPPPLFLGRRGLLVQLLSQSQRME